MKKNIVLISFIVFIFLFLNSKVSIANSFEFLKRSKNQVSFMENVCLPNSNLSLGKIESTSNEVSASFNSYFSSLQNVSFSNFNQGKTDTVQILNTLGMESSCTQPSNDDCFGAFSAIPLSIDSICNPLLSSSCGATSSGISSCVGTADDDVFFSFVPNSNIAQIAVFPSNTYDAVFQILVGVCGGSLFQLACVNSSGLGINETLILNGLSLGTTYYIRVWHFGSSYGATGNFSICAYNCFVPQPVNVTLSNSSCNFGYLTATGGSGGTIYYQGKVSGGTSVAYPTTTKAITTSGTYYFRALNNCGWGQEDSITVTLNTNPDTVFVSGSGTYCFNTNLVASGGLGGSIYWQGTTSYGSSLNTLASSQIVSASGTYYFRAYNNCGWGAQGSVTVIIENLPATVVSSVAALSCGVATISAGGGTGGTIYWQGTIYNGTSLNTPATSQVVNNSGTYFYRSHNNCGWGGNVGIHVTVPLVPAGAVLITGDGTFCNSTTITALGGTNGTIYWQGNTSGGTSTAIPANSNPINGSGTYFFRAYNACGWGTQDSAIVNIEFIVPSAVTVNGAGLFCENTAITANGGQGGTMYWQGLTNGGTSIAIPSNNEVITSTGLYYFRAKNTCGWGPQGSAAVAIVDIDSTISFIGNSLSSNASNASYQWLSCPAMQSIIGETNQVFSPTQNGSYAVVSMLNSCSDTSECVTITISNILPNYIVNSPLVYPSPASEYLTIDFREPISDSVVLHVVNTLGQTCKTENFYSINNAEIMKIDVRNLATGIYFLKVYSKTIGRTFKFQKL